MFPKFLQFFQPLPSLRLYGCDAHQPRLAFAVLVTMIFVTCVNFFERTLIIVLIIESLSSNWLKTVY